MICSIDWQAAATFVTGIAAVIAAYLIGRRQVAISIKQAEIQAKQVELEQRKLDQDLYDKRFTVYDATARFLSAMLGSGETSNEVERGFLIVLVESRFLFREGVHAGLQEIWEKQVAQRYLRRKMEADHKKSGEYEEGDPDKQYELNIWIDQRIRTLPELFNQLKIG